MDDIKKWLYNIQEQEVIKTPFYSPYSSDQKSFIDLNQEELIDLDFWIRKLLLKIASGRRRMKKRNLMKGDLDLKQLIRSRFIKGDELIRLYYRYPKKEKTKIVLLCDVSKSMDLHSRFITALIGGIYKVFDFYAIYMFNTELHQIRSEEEWKNVAGLWSGGTRIGYCLEQWLEMLPVWFDKKTKVIIYSDGWDTGDLDQLDQSMYLIRQLSSKVFWFNPVIKNETDLQTSGMSVAYKYIDVLAPVYNLRSLKDLIRRL